MMAQALGEEEDKLTLPVPTEWGVIAGWPTLPSKLAKSAKPPPPAPTDAARRHCHRLLLTRSAMESTAKY